MDYHVLDPTALEPTSDYPCDRRSISDAVGLGTLAAAIYEIDPGEQLARAYHYHEQREELFYVLAGSLSVQTPVETYAVEAGQVFVAEPESPHRAFVPADSAGAARVLGIGAPQFDPGRPYDPDADSLSE